MQDKLDRLENSLESLEQYELDRLLIVLAVIISSIFLIFKDLQAEEVQFNFEGRMFTRLVPVNVMLTQLNELEVPYSSDTEQAILALDSAQFQDELLGSLTFDTEAPLSGPFEYTSTTNTTVSLNLAGADIPVDLTGGLKIRNAHIGTPEFYIASVPGSPTEARIKFTLHPLVTKTFPGLPLNPPEINYQFVFGATAAIEYPLVLADGSTEIKHQALMEFTITSLYNPALKAIDPGDTVIDEQGDITTDVEQIINEPRWVEGTTTDGVSTVLLTMDNPGPVVLAIESGEESDGTLSTLDDSSTGSTITVEPQTVRNDRSVIAAKYIPPSDFSEDPLTLFKRKIKIIASPEDTALEAQELEVTLIRPPALLVHGIWDNGGLTIRVDSDGKPRCKNVLVDYDPYDPDSGTYVCSGKPLTYESSDHTWEKAVSVLISNGILPFRVDYSVNRANAKSFDPTLPLSLNESVRELKQSISTVKAYLREENKVAMRQVHVVGHSMGGLVTRAYEIDLGEDKYQYRRKDNFMKGDIQRLITIGTPHMGSPFANLVSNNTCLQKFMDLEIKFLGVTIKEATPTGLGALNDLRTDSEAVNTLNSGKSKIKTHTIVGLANEFQRTVGNSVYQLLDGVACIFSNVYHGLDELFGAGGAGDLTVSLSSQKAKNTTNGNVQTLVGDVVHSRSFSIRTPLFDLELGAETQSDELLAEVVGLLNSFEKFEDYNSFAGN